MPLASQTLLSLCLVLLQGGLHGGCKQNGRVCCISRRFFLESCVNLQISLACLASSIEICSWGPCWQGLVDPAIWSFLSLCCDSSLPSKARTRLVLSVLFDMYPVPAWWRQGSRALISLPAPHSLEPLVLQHPRQLVFTHASCPAPALNLHSSL